MVIKYKASDLISDFNLNAKTTLTQLGEVFGTEIKKSTVLTEEQANIAFEMYSQQGKIDNIATYLDKKEPKAEPKKETKPAVKEEKKAEKPQPKKDAPKADKKPAKEAPKADRQERPARDNKDRKELRQDNRNKDSRQDSRQDNRQQPKKQENKPAAQQQKPVVQPAAKPAQPKAPHNPNEPLKRADGTVVETKTNKKPKEEKQSTERQEFVTVTVDTRQSNVNMDKFNEKYDELAGTKNYGGGQRKNQQGGKQKFSNKNKQNSKNPYAKKKQETEAEKLERLQIGRAHV